MTSDFRSDTLTKPTEAMRHAMATAEVGDDVWGEDPTVQRLERAAGELLGCQAALFVPSGTMGNQVAVHVHCRPGDELLCEARSHVFLFEGGSVARLSGTQVRTFEATSGFVDPAALPGLVRAADVHFPRSRLLVVENTHNMAGGRVLGPAPMAAIVAAARELDLRIHVDGARLINAAVAAGCAPAELTRGVDSVSMCLSKGLGAPVGSVLAGSAAFVADARKVRKAFGGGMRQAGILAAAGLIALEEGPRWVAADHGRASRLADGLRQVAGLEVADPESNIVMVDVAERPAAELVAFLGERQVRVAQVGPRRIRLVTHHDVGDDDVERCLTVARQWAET